MPTLVTAHLGWLQALPTAREQQQLITACQRYCCGPIAYRARFSLRCAHEALPHVCLA